MDTEEEGYENVENDTLCTICNAEFLDAEDLNVHLTQVHPVETFSLIQCHFCKFTLSNLDSYACHVRDKHVKSIKICTYCTKAFTDSDELRHHERRHYSVKKSHKRCSQCSEQFDNMSQLQIHEYEVHNNFKDGVLLQDYSSILSSVLNMKLFLFLQAIRNKDILSCITCKYKSVDLGKYIKHLHEKECRALTCNNCSNIFKQKKYIIRHLQSFKKCSYYTEKMNKQRDCPHCFKSVNSLFFADHVKQCRPMKCSMCNIIFESMNELSEHQALEHPSSIAVKLCQFCSRQCVGAKALLKHMTRVHAQEFHLYKYKCVECNLIFKHPQKLFAHYFNGHKDFEPFTCKICNKKFRLRKKFTLHIKLDHKSVGFIEFDKNYHVFFSDTKSDNPFIPTCVIPEQELKKYRNEAKKIPKVVKKREKDHANDTTDFNSQTETEGQMTDVNKENTNSKVKKEKKKRGRKPKRKIEASPDSSEDDEPLVSLLKRKKVVPKKHLDIFTNFKTSKNNRNQLTCKKCDKYCYTFQNFQHHISLHKRNEQKSCIKCSEVFNSNEKLQKHIETKHSSSKLTETLRSLIEKRKKGIVTQVENTSKSDGFINTIKRAKCEPANVKATVKLIKNDISLQKFIENFTPETSDVKTSNAIIESSVTVKTINTPFYRKPTINMIKFKPEATTNGKLAMPVKFKSDGGEKVTVTMKLVPKPVYVPPSPQQEEIIDYDGFSDHNEEIEHERIDIPNIPEVAEEVLLEGTEEPKIVHVAQRIIIPELPLGLKDISIAHLLPEAPYYKIVKVNDVLKDPPPPEPKEPEKKDVIKLPDGTKLVTVNPLAHLLGDKNVDDLLEPIKSKYYKPKMGRNVENIFAKAMEKANTPTKLRKSTIKKEKKK